MKLSIITINYNDAEGLRRTLASVGAQTYHDIEHVIVDGASTDGSVEVIKDYVRRVKSEELRVKSVIWVSEPDTGIYNAMNKGVRMSHGEYTLMLNSGDYLVDEHVVERVMPELDGTDIIQGNIMRERNGKKYVDRGYGKSDINFIDVQQGHFLHQASFCKKDLFEKYGYFDETYRIHGDTVFYIKSLGYGEASFKYINLTIADFAPAGISSNETYADLCTKEYQRWTTELFSPRLWQTCIDYDKKGRMYDTLHRHPLLWKMTMLLVTIANKMDKQSKQ